MKRLLCLIAATVAAATYANPPDPINLKNTEKLTATVESIDLPTRMVTLRGDSGKTETIEVSPDVQNLAQVKTGDKVVVRYFEGLAAQVKKKGELSPADEMQGAAYAAKAPAGEKPAGLVGSTVNSTVVIQAVDRNAHTVTFDGPNGTHTVAVKKPEAQKFIAGLKKG